jgi:hypothetical protein
VPDGVHYYYTLNYTFSVDDELNGLTTMLKMSDLSGYTVNGFTQLVISNHNNPGGGITFTENVSNSLPAGHSFESLVVELYDDLNGYYSKTIESINGSCTFNHGEGGLTLSNSLPNRTYTVRVTLSTNLSVSGAIREYTIRYISQ